MATTTYPPNPIQIENMTDFTGGLNLRADAFQLHGSESPDMLNVDLDPRGGFSLRDGTTLLNSTVLGITPKNLWSFSNTAGTKQVMVQNSIGTANQIAFSTGGNFTANTPDALACTGVMRATTFKDNCYIQRAAQQPVVKWTGAASSVLGVAFNDDFTTPTGLNMPKAKCITTHGGYVWVANTNEAGTAFGSRVRWSHPNQPGDFRTNDFIDIDVGMDGDEITALLPQGDRLLVFKANRCYAIYGYDFASFSVQSISANVGAISQEAVVNTDYGVFFFSWPEGLMKVEGNTASWAFERIWPAINDGRILSSNQSGITVGWINRRIWVNVPYVTGTTNNRSFVLDPSLAHKKRYASNLGSEGGWTQYDLPLGPMLEWQPPGTAATFLACSANAARVLKLHQVTTTDDLGAGAVNIASYYTTRWFDAGNIAAIKRWKRPEIILRGGTTSRLTIDVWHDYDTGNVERTFTLDTTAPPSGTLIWGTGLWGSSTWAGDSVTSEEIHHLSTLGRSRATRLRFTGPTPSVDWTVDSIAIKYIPRRIRA